MNNRTLIAVGLAAVVLYLVWQRQRAASGSGQLVPTSLLDWSPSPAQDAAWWAANSGGTPSAAGSSGDGAVTPGTMTEWLGRIFPGYTKAWSAPNAATNPLQQLSAAPAGASVPPYPVPPQQPTPQSAVQSSSPYLPQAFALAAPVSSLPWATELTLLDPLAVLGLGGGDYIDAVKVQS